MNPSYLPLDTSPADFEDVYLKLTGHEQLEIAHQPKDMFKSCKWMNADGHPVCTDLMTNPQASFNSRMGVCYIFNFIKPSYKGPRLQSMYTGVGLALEIDTESKTKWVLKIAHNSC